MNKKVLIIDDDGKLQDLLRDYLEGYGFSIVSVLDGKDALGKVKEESPDIIVLDIMLPGKDGFEILKEIRQEYSTAVIMLTARGEETDRIVGLELGADDYLPKPFNPRELVARINAVLRRSDNGAYPDPIQHEEEKRVLEVGDIILDMEKRSITSAGKEIELTTAEYEFLKVLMERPNRVYSRDELMDLARGRDFAVFDRSIDVHISRLRAKIEKDPKNPQRIKTVWGAGYMFVEE